MSTIRVTVTFAGSVPPDAQAARLAELAAVLRQTLADGQRLTRLAGLSLPASGATAPTAVGAAPIGRVAGHAGDRIFKLDMPDGADPRPFLRAVGGWFMTNPAVQLAVKVDGPPGGVSLRMDGWSAVAFAAVVERVVQCLTFNG